jgi:hypothetical protein
MEMYTYKEYTSDLVEIRDDRFRARRRVLVLVPQQEMCWEAEGLSWEWRWWTVRSWDRRQYRHH